MSRTEELLQQIKDALVSGRLEANRVPLADIKVCVRNEIELHRNTFLEKQYKEVLTHLDNLCEGITDTETDVSKIILFLDAALLGVSMISKAIQQLANGTYWMFCHQDELDNPEVMEIIDYVEKERAIRLINYDFMKGYESMPCEVYLDQTCQMAFVLHDGHRMYFPRDWNVEKIQGYYRTVVAEQDEHSPHSYSKVGYDVKEGDVVVDAGGAEGIFALNVLNKASKIYIIEAEKSWVEALEHTFAGEEKVEIIHAFLDEKMNGNCVSLDGLFVGKELNYIKMDIEGYEKPALLGGKQILQQAKDVRCAICSYHCREDEEWLKDFFVQLGCETTTSSGYMCPDWTIEAYLEAELRRGIVFARK